LIRFGVCAVVLLALVSPAQSAISSAAAKPKDAELPYLFDRLKTPAYRKSVRAILQGPKVQPWVADFVQHAGPAVCIPGKRVTVSKKVYEVYGACRPHQCSAEQLKVMYTPGGKQAWAVQREQGDKRAANQDQITFFGNPGETMRKALAAELDR
jgi:hypothetical protein